MTFGIDAEVIASTITLFLVNNCDPVPGIGLNPNPGFNAELRAHLRNVFGVPFNNCGETIEFQSGFGNTLQPLVMVQNFVSHCAGIVSCNITRCLIELPPCNRGAILSKCI